VVRTFSYEQYGRPETTTTTIGSDTYVASTTYDQFGRVFQRFDGAETHSGLEYRYTADGHLEAAIESRGSASVTVERYRITAKDARGQVTGMSKGGIDVSRTYSADSGRLQSIYAQNQLAVTIQDFAFEWDVLGNLTDKVDSHRALSEQYDYDALNRLTSVSGSSSAQRQLSVANGTPIQWRFAEESAASATRSLLQQRGISGIDIVHVP